MNASSRRANTLRVLAVAGALVVGGIVIFLGARDGSPATAAAAPTVAATSTSTSTTAAAKPAAGTTDRATAWEDAMTRGKSFGAYPRKPEDLVKAFWEGAARKDYDTLTMYCPGSLAADFRKHYERWTPGTVHSVGAAESHPKAKNVKIYPVKVDFPGFPNKTIKMAVTTLPDGRPAIDGQHTIWW